MTRVLKSIATLSCRATPLMLANFLGIPRHMLAGCLLTRGFRRCDGSQNSKSQLAGSDETYRRTWQPSPRSWGMMTLMASILAAVRLPVLQTFLLDDGSGSMAMKIPFDQCVGPWASLLNNPTLFVLEAVKSVGHV